MDWKSIETAPKGELILIRDQEGDIRYAELVESKDGNSGELTWDWWDARGDYVGDKNEYDEWAYLPDDFPIAELRVLSLDELRGMDGCPVWIQQGDGKEYWAIVELLSEKTIELLASCIDASCLHMEFINMKHNDPAGHFGLHVLGWRALTRKPTKGGDEG